LSKEKIALSTSGLYSLPTCHQPINPAIPVSPAWLYWISYQASQFILGNESRKPWFPNLTTIGKSMQFYHQKKPTYYSFYIQYLGSPPTNPQVTMVTVFITLTSNYVCLHRHAISTRSYSSMDAKGGRSHHVSQVVNERAWVLQQTLMLIKD